MSTDPYVRWLLIKVSGGWLETFTVCYDESVVAPGYELVDEWPAEFSKGPYLTEVMVRSLPSEWSDADIAEYFGGNLSGQRSPLWVSSEGIEPLGDAEFWALIETEPRGLARVTRVLRARVRGLDDDEVVGFALALQSRVDAIGSVVAGLVGGATSDPQSDDEVEAMCAAIIAAGREVFDRAMEDPSGLAEFVTGAGLAAEPLLLIAESELARRRGVAHVAILPPGADDPGGDDPVPVRRRWADVQADYQSVRDVAWNFAPDHRAELRHWYVFDDLSDWVTVRYVTRSRDTLIERMVTTWVKDGPYSPEDQVEVGPARWALTQRTAEGRVRDRLRADEEIVCMESQGANPAPWNGGLFQIHRFSRLKAERYRERYLIEASARDRPRGKDEL